ncbi:uncharacterized protein LOC110179810 [Drosophila serrata]|uniref:uncharacterized protein LOC110179810 n=1 Tax=Drosophila serrata TaxID=7274 RepID=UPI000A1CFDA9|nr:uncharacterized protein LOC110179810 [Drosophila serrata]
MEKQAKQRFNFRKLATSKKPEEVTVLTKSVDNKIDIDKEPDQPIVYDYMKYPANKKKNAKQSKCPKIQKTVTFKTMVELVTYTDNWKMKMIHGKLRTEEEQRKSSLKRRNF